MVKVCSAVGCKSKYVNGSGITFHQIPKHEVLQKAWLQALRRKDWVKAPPLSYSHCYVCSVHFKDEDFDRSSNGIVRLNQGAIPSNFPSFPKYLHKVSSLPRRKIKRIVLEIPEGPSIDISNPEVVLEVNRLNLCSSDGAEVPIVVEPAEFVSAEAASGIVEEHADHSYACTSDLGQVSPTNKIMKRKLDNCENKINEMKKKLRLLQRRERRHKKKIANLNDIVKSLKVKKFMEEESLDILQHTLPPSCEELLKLQRNKLLGTAMPCQYPPALRVFALTLHYYSPKAYEYVRRTFNTCLPHPRTLGRWYHGPLTLHPEASASTKCGPTYHPGQYQNNKRRTSTCKDKNTPTRKPSGYEGHPISSSMLKPSAPLPSPNQCSSTSQTHENHSILSLQIPPQRPPTRSPEHYQEQADPHSLDSAILSEQTKQHNT